MRVRPGSATSPVCSRSGIVGGEFSRVGRRQRCEKVVFTCEGVPPTLQIRAGDSSTVGPLQEAEIRQEMARWALLLTLFGTTLFGPSFCCCSWRAVVHAAVHEVPAPNCCCRTDSCPDRSESPHRCPCNQHGKSAVPLPSENAPVLSFHMTGRFESPSALADPYFADSAYQPTGTSCPPCAFPRLTGRGILLRVHVLRC